MQPVITHQDNLAPLILDAKLLRDLACSKVEKTFALKAYTPPTWGIAYGSKTHVDHH